MGTLGKTGSMRRVRMSPSRRTARRPGAVPRWLAAAIIGGIGLAAYLALAGPPGPQSPTPGAPGQSPAAQAPPRASAADARGSAAGSTYGSAGPTGLRPDLTGVPPMVYVPNSKSGTVDVIDPAQLKVVRQIPVGRLPQHVTPSWDMRTLYINNNQGNSLTPLDPITGRVGTPIPVEDPYNLYFTPDGTRAIVVAERLKRLDFRDPKSWGLIKSVSIPYSGPNHLDFSSDGRYLLISSEFSGYLTKVDLGTLQITGKVNVGGQPVDVRLSPDGRLFYVANQKRNGVSVVDPVSMSEVSFIKTGRGTHGFVVSRDGRSLYVTNRGEGTISVIDLSSRQVVATWTTGGSPDMGGVSPDGSQLWVSGRYNGQVYVVDTSSGKLIKAIAVGREPHGLDFYPQPGRFSMGHTGNYR